MLPGVETMSKGFIVFLIRLYRFFISPLLGACCRFEPSCSCYAEEALRRYGLWLGLQKTVLRLLRCHPLAKGGWDPVK